MQPVIKPGVPPRAALLIVAMLFAAHLHGVGDAAPGVSIAKNSSFASCSTPTIACCAPVESISVNTAFSCDEPSEAKAVDAPESKVDYEPYIADMTRRMRRQWYPPKHADKSRVVITYAVDRDGKPGPVAFIESTGCHPVDISALWTISRQESFRPLPAGSPDSVRFKATIDFKAKTPVAVELLP